MKRPCLMALATASVLLAFAAIGLTAEEKAAPDKPAAEEKAPPKFELPEPLTFKMEEVPAFGKTEVDGRTQMRSPNGPLVPCTKEPSKDVKAYPTLKSKQPLYGSIKIDSSLYDPSEGKTLYFVLDESGTPPETAEEDAKKDEAKDKPATDASEAKDKPRPPAKSTYDRLYFDLNGDGDLTNDQVLEPAKTPPFEGVFGRASLQLFDDVVLSIDCGPPQGKRPFPVMLQLLAVSPQMSYVQIVPKLARRGTVKIADEEYTATLTQSRMISGRYDRPFVFLELSPVNPSPGKRAWLTSGYLGQVRSIDGQLVYLSATPMGDELTVGPYRGDTGVLEVGPGGRAITELGAVGGLISHDMMIPLGETGLLGRIEEMPRRYVLPVGDYLPTSLTVRHGRLRFSARALRPNDLPPGEQPKAPTYGIKIRKDQPCVLEFSGKPEVLFLSPNKDQVFKPGQEVQVRVMLAEPGQGIVITGLEDTTKKTGEAKYRLADKEIAIPQYTRLDPTIVIRNAAGEELATGKMPFG